MPRVIAEMAGTGDRKLPCHPRFTSITKTSKVAFRTEAEKMKLAENEMRQSVEAMCKVFASMDTDGNNSLSREEFLSGIDSPEVLQTLNALDISLGDAEHLFEIQVVRACPPRWSLKVSCP